MEPFMTTATHTPANQVIPFAQGLDRTRPLTLVPGQKRKGSLVWRYDDSQELVTVPDIWYNQPVEWRIEAATWQVKAIREAHSQRKANPPADMNAGTFYTAGEAWQAALTEDLQRIAALEALISQMQATGNVLV